jgi:uncharacterized protein YbjQ (UPF0145 family)
MDRLEKYLEMLSSPKADTRFTACVQLRGTRESSEAIVIALEKACEDGEKFVADAAQKALDAPIHLEMLGRLGRTHPKMQERALQAALNENEAKELAAITIVTTLSIEGKKISKYLGIVSAEVVLGTGLFTDLETIGSDFFGVRSSALQNKLKQAKDASFLELKRKAYMLGANTVLAVDMDYAVIGHNMIMLVTNGTAVWIE